LAPAKPALDPRNRGSASMTQEPPVEPKPASSVLLVASRALGRRRADRGLHDPPQQGDAVPRRLYGVPGGKVDAADGDAHTLACCRGLEAKEADAIFPGADGVPALAYWVTAIRELIEEKGLLLVCDDRGRPLDAGESGWFAALAERARATLMAGAPFGELLEASGCYCDLRPLRYLSHFITPKTSPIRFHRALLPLSRAGGSGATALHRGDIGSVLDPSRRGVPADSWPVRWRWPNRPSMGLAYLSQFESLDAVWKAHTDDGGKFHGIVDRIDFKVWKDFDWKQSRWTSKA